MFGKTQIEMKDIWSALFCQSKAKLLVPQGVISDVLEVFWWWNAMINGQDASHNFSNKVRHYSGTDSILLETLFWKFTLSKKLRERKL